METKIISQLPITEALNESANMLIEENGATKRIPASKAIPSGVVKSVNGTAPDEAGDVEVEIPEGFSGSWNDLTDKPFDETGFKIEWDGNTEGHTVVTTVEGRWYHVSDEILTVDDFVGATICYSDGTYPVVVAPDDPDYTDDGWVTFGGVTCIPTPNYYVEYLDATFERVGIYFASLTHSFKKEKVQTLDLKFLKAEPNKQLETDEYGNAVWEDKMRVKGGPKWEQLFSKEIEFIKSSYVGAPNIGYGSFDNVNNISIIEGDSYRLCGPWGDSEFIATADGVGFSGESGPYVWIEGSKVRAKQPQDMSTEYTKFTLYHLTQTPDTIDPKFLPSGVQWFSICNEGSESVVPVYRGICSASEPNADTAPVSEVLEAFKSGTVRIYYAPSDCYGTMTGHLVRWSDKNVVIGMSVGPSEALTAVIGPAE